MESITYAKRQLFENLRSHHDGIVGTGIKEQDGSEYIVVYINAHDKKQFVPPHFMGNKVVTEVKGPLKAL